MPLVVDHDERRRQIAEVTAQMIGRHGMEAVTLREVARAAGFSAAIVGHYFRDKLHLLSFTSANARARATARVEAALVAGIAPLVALEEYLPLDEDRQVAWQAWFGFWSKATAEPAIAAERLASVTQSRRFIAELVAEAAAMGTVPAGIDPAGIDCEAAATRAQVLIDGMACLVTMEPGEWPEARQRTFFAEELAKLLGAGAPPHA